MNGPTSEARKGMCVKLWCGWISAWVGQRQTWGSSIAFCLCLAFFQLHSETQVGYAHVPWQKTHIFQYLDVYV